MSRTLALFAVLASLCALAAAAPLNVHVVCHTHDDVGWLKTVDQYYMGANNSIQHAGVQYVLDSVIPALEQNPARKFIYVEIGFFIRWWRQQTPSMQQRVQTLVSNGQLEFINGGWCMNDEAGTYYNDIIDQMSLGHAFLLETFGVKPRIGWHIDPFGHSSVQASLFAQMGFDGFFFGRADYDDKNNRLKNRQMEYIWRGSPSLGKSAEIFTGLLYNGYGPPDGFCFDLFCQDDPIQDDPNLFNVNIGQRAIDFAAWCLAQSASFTTNNIILTMGSDFQYENANEWFKNLDKLLGYIQQHPELGLNVFYSTPSMYVDAIHAANLTWTVKTDDLFPYADCPWCFWTGYFVSRASLKGYVRNMNNYLQTCRQMEAIVGPVGGASSAVLNEAMGVAQHHDAVAGTEKQHVAFDYAERLSIGQSVCETLTTTALLNLSAAQPSDSLVQCRLLNESLCGATTSLAPGQSVAVLLWNPLGVALTGYPVKLPVPSNGMFTVLDHTQSAQPNQVIQNIDSVEPNGAPYSLVFEVSVPAMGFTTYYVSYNSAEQEVAEEPELKLESEDDTVSIQNTGYTVSFSTSTGRMVSIQNKYTGQLLVVDQSLMWWNASDGNNVNSSQTSGAYIFRPNGTDPFPIAPGNVAQLTVTSSGGVVQEVRQQWAPWAVQYVRLYQGMEIEIEYQIGPIPTSDGLGKEIITRFDTSLVTQGTWYTDANGREMQTRIRNYRATWTYNNTEPIAGNYVPINAATYIQDVDNGNRLTIMTDRSQGGASILDGSIEVMLHRRLCYDDYRGVGEPLSEPGLDGKGLIIRTKHWLVFDQPQVSSTKQRMLTEILNHGPLLSFSQPLQSANQWSSTHLTSYSALKQDLPLALHLLTVQLLAPKQYLVRLAHQFAVNENTQFSIPYTVDLGNLFNFGTLASATELGLSANQPGPVQRLQWNTNSDSNTKYQNPPASPLRKEVLEDGRISFSVTINPMEIRTFNLQFS